jgi:hypothetical protein
VFPDRGRLALSRSLAKLQRIDPDEFGKAALLEQAPQLRLKQFEFIAKALDHRGEESARTKLGEIERRLSRAQGA